MATCIIDITGDIESGAAANYDELSSGVSFDLTFSPLTKAKLRINTTQQETIVLSFTNTGTAAPVTITIFKLNSDNTTITNQGSVSTSDNNVTFQKDVQPGTYFVCFATIFNPVTATFTATFSGFVSSARLSAEGRDGMAMLDLDLTTRKGARVCREPMTFTLIDGVLPPGIEMGTDGRVRGDIPDLDCLGDALSPSINWFRQIDGTWESLPRRWTFTVKVQMVNYPEVVATETFHIPVYNDWDRDRDAFMKDADKGFDRILETQTTDTFKLETTLCPPCSIDVSQNDTGKIEQWLDNVSVETNGPEVQKFIDKFMSSAKFKTAMNITETSINTVESQIVDGRNTTDVDHLFLKYGDELNQKLFPWTMFAYTGESMQGELDV